MSQDQQPLQHKTAESTSGQLGMESGQSAAPPAFGLMASPPAQRQTAQGKSKTTADASPATPVLQGRFLNDVQVNYIATNVHTNLQKAVVPFEDISGDLSRMRRDVEDIAKLKTEYTARFTTTIEADLAAKFAGAQLNLLNSMLTAEPAAAAVLREGEAGHRPSDGPSVDAAVDRVHAGLFAASPNTAEIFAALIPFDGQLLTLSSFREKYNTKYGQSVITDIFAKLPEAARKYAIKLVITYYPDADGDIMGIHHAERAERHFNNMSVVDMSKLITVLSNAATYQERQYIFKAVSANRTISEVETFAGKIKAKGNDWMQNNLRLTGSTTGTGIQQQWSHSCNVTATQALQGEMDPVYALSIHENNPNPYTANNANGTTANPSLGANQQASLQSPYAGTAFGAHSGTASPRNNIAGGSGRWADDLMNANTTNTGLTSTPGTISATFTVANAVAAIETAARRGNPVPIVIGNAPNAYTHYVVVTRVDFGVTPNKYMIHDPWSGTTVERTRNDLINGTLNIAGSNQISAVEVQSEVNN